MLARANFISHRKLKKKTKEIVEIYMSACMIHEGRGAELDLRYEKETRDSVVMCYHEKISPY